MLPPDDDLAQELATPTYTVKNGVIKVTDKETLRELLGRSPDKGDALCLTFADDEVQDIPPISMNDLKSIFHALRLVKDETGWGRVTITIKNGKMEDVDTTISKKLTINRNVNGI